jgi:hypothetical protein
MNSYLDKSNEITGIVKGTSRNLPDKDDLLMAVVNFNAACSEVIVSGPYSKK